MCFIAHQGTKEGAGLFMLDEIDYLLRHGVSVSAVLPWDGPLADALAERGVEFAFVPNAWWTKSRGLDSRGAYENAITAARTMAAVFLQWKIDVVYTETVVAPAGAIGAALAGLPHVWHIHEFSYNPMGIEMAIPKASLARLMDVSSNFVFFNSKVVAREWEGHLPLEKTRVVYNWTSTPVDDALPELSDDISRSLLTSRTSFIAVIVGSVVPLKRQRDAVEAVGTLLNEGLDIALLVVGPATNSMYQSELQSIVQRNRWDAKIRFLGYTPNPHRIMQHADVTLMCSESEGFGRVTIESMAQGTPVIGADSGGTTEIIESGVDGLLFPPGDVPALTDRLRLFIRDQSLRARLAVGAKEKASRFRGADSAMTPVLEILMRLVSEKNPSWPLGTLINAGLADVQERPRAIRRGYDRGRRFLRSLFGRAR